MQAADFIVGRSLAVITIIAGRDAALRLWCEQVLAARAQVRGVLRVDGGSLRVVQEILEDHFIADHDRLLVITSPEKISNLEDLLAAMPDPEDETSTLVCLEADSVKRKGGRRWLESREAQSPVDWVDCNSPTLDGLGRICKRYGIPESAVSMVLDAVLGDTAALSVLFAQLSVFPRPWDEATIAILAGSALPRNAKLEELQIRPGDPATLPRRVKDRLLQMAQLAPLAYVKTMDVSERFDIPPYLVNTLRKIAPLHSPEDWLTAVAQIGVLEAEGAGLPCFQEAIAALIP